MLGWTHLDQAQPMSGEVIHGLNVDLAASIGHWREILLGSSIGS